MNGAHRELRARLADGLRGDDAHGGADVDGASRGEVPAIALLADAILGPAGEQCPQLDPREAMRAEHLEVVGRLDVGIPR